MAPAFLKGHQETQKSRESERPRDKAIRSREESGTVEDTGATLSEETRRRKILLLTSSWLKAAPGVNASKLPQFFPSFHDTGRNTGIEKACQ